MSIEGREIVCLFGSYSPKPGDVLYQDAYEIGQGLARAGYIVANGGYRGIMEASAKGAKDAGGVTIGVTCSVFRGSGGQRVRPNEYIDHEICHDHILQRIKAMMQMSSAFVVLEGGTGTLSEFALVWEYVNKHFMTARPIFVYGDFWRPMVDRMVAAHPKSGKHLHFVYSPQQIIEVAASEISRTRADRAKVLLPEAPAEPAVETSGDGTV